MDDGSLVREAVAGSLTAFTSIFDRHVGQVHDMALALVRDRGAAMSIVQATFREASERLEGLQEPDRLRVWLLALTRFQAAQLHGDQAGPDRQPAGSDPIAERAQLAGQVWEATADLPLRERTLLDLRFRQHLEGHDLADALGVAPAELPELLAWLEEVEKGLAGFLIVRQSEQRCADLQMVLRSWDGRFTPLVASHIAAHLDSCRHCREAGAALPSPLALYASAPQAPLPGPIDADGSVPTQSSAPKASA